MFQIYIDSGMNQYIDCMVETIEEAVEACKIRLWENGESLSDIGIQAVEESEYEDLEFLVENPEIIDMRNALEEYNDIGQSLEDGQSMISFQDFVKNEYKNLIPAAAV